MNDLFIQVFPSLLLVSLLRAKYLPEHSAIFPVMVSESVHGRPILVWESMDWINLAQDMMKWRAVNK